MPALSSLSPTTPPCREISTSAASKVGLLVLLSVGSCAAPRPTPLPLQLPRPAEEGASACKAAMTHSAEMLTSPEMSTCSKSSDCRVVSPLVSGRCGVSTNLARFTAQHASFLAAAEACEDALRIEPACSPAQAGCVSGRCATESPVELPDDCQDLTSALPKALEALNTCEKDDDCMFADDEHLIAKTNIDDANALVFDRQRACGISAIGLTVSHEPRFGGGLRTELTDNSAVDAICVEHRCFDARSTASKFTTVVTARREGMTRPRVSYDCLLREVRKRIPAGTLDGHYAMSARVDTRGRAHDFRFLKPLDPRLQIALAEVITACGAQPATYAGKPIEVRYVFQFQFVLGGH